MNKLVKKLIHLKNTHVVFYFLWTIYIYFRGKLSRLFISDIRSMYSRYKKLSGKRPNLDDPILFSEKLQWIKLNYKNEEMEKCADKFKVRDWIKSKKYPYLLNKLINVYDSVDEIDIDRLPNRFVLKAVHGSGWNLIVDNKEKVNWFLWKLILKVWMKSDIYWAGREWVYKNIEPRIICEEYLEDSSGSLRDYKFHCFNGKPIYIQANQGRGVGKNHVQNFYNNKWEFQKFGKDIKFNDFIKIKKPKLLNEMLEIASDLSSNFAYVRVDFYEVGNQIIFGEMTFFPAGGYPDFDPKKYDEIWGRHLDISGLY